MRHFALVMLLASSGFAQPPNGTTPASPTAKPPEDIKTPTPNGKELPLLPASPKLVRADAKDVKGMDVSTKSLEDAVSKGVELLLAMQEGDNRAEWPYEGVYRVNRQIPVGYRIGGTAIAGIALLNAPGYEKDKARQESVARAVGFVCRGIDQPLMSYENYDGNYDVRGWGYTYGVLFLLELKDKKAVPKGEEATVEKALQFYITAIHETVIPEQGGWNYARPSGRKVSAPPSPFMTVPTLEALFAAKAHGYKVDAKVVNDALDFLEKARGPQDTVVYSGAGAGKGGPSQGVPGAIGRMCSTEWLLMKAGRGKIENVRNAVDKFVEHWVELDKRRVMDGTHVAPYNVAPYYFMYGHRYAALAVELLPEAERPAYREKINRLLLSVRSEDGSWDDRVFKRTANFGTSFAMLAIMTPTLPKAAGWEEKK